jgi:hypothetical protein
MGVSNRKGVFRVQAFRQAALSVSFKRDEKDENCE